MLVSDTAHLIPFEALHRYQFIFFCKCAIFIVVCPMNGSLLRFKFTYNFYLYYPLF